jgi:hypothetical protein
MVGEDGRRPPEELSHRGNGGIKPQRHGGLRDRKHRGDRARMEARPSLRGFINMDGQDRRTTAG